jgi:hypothetical protein
MARFSSPGTLSSRSAVAENPEFFSVLSEIYEFAWKELNISSGLLTSVFATAE